MAAIGDNLKVTRDDILDFPAETIKLILEMQKDGWRAQRSNKNHVMLLAPDGETRLGASRNADSAHYLAEDLRRYNRAKGLVETMPTKVRTVAQKWPCPRPGCPKIFNTESKLNAHMGVDHEGLLKCPDCDETFKDPKVLGRHRGIKHGYVSPRYAMRKAQEAKRQEKAVLDEVMAEVDKGTVTESRSEGEMTKLYGSVTNPEDIESVAILPEAVIEVLERNGIVNPDYSDLFTTTELIKSEAIAINNDADHISIYVAPQESDVEHITFLDERDSWTMDLEDIAEKKVHEIGEILKAAGLAMEIRVWKE